MTRREFPEGTATTALSVPSQRKALENRAASGGNGYERSCEERAGHRRVQDPLCGALLWGPGANRQGCDD